MAGAPHQTTATDEAPLRFRDRLTQSRLYQSGGFLLVTGLIGGETLAALCAESDAARVGGSRAQVPQSDGTEGRGGSPARAYRSASGGELHWQLYGSQPMAETLARLCGVTLSPSGAGTYSYYEDPGDFLALHRDVVDCDVAVITCLQHRTAENSSGGLLVYPQYVNRSLSEVRAAGRATATPLRVGRGETVVLLGGFVPHEVTPLSADEQRVVAIMCYRIQE
jgi:hypothetical protein